MATTYVKAKFKDFGSFQQERTLKSKSNAVLLIVVPFLAPLRITPLSSRFRPLSLTAVFVTTPQILISKSNHIESRESLYACINPSQRVGLSPILSWPCCPIVSEGSITGFGSSVRERSATSPASGFYLSRIPH